MNTKSGTRNPLKNGPGGIGIKEADVPPPPVVKSMDDLHALHKEAKRLTTGLWSDKLTNFQRIAKSKQYRKAVALHGETRAKNHIAEFFTLPAAALSQERN